ncbi:MAG: shikimate kinase [Candidatus Binatia bacterium]
MSPRENNNIALTGFMASGKSAVGRRLARRLGKRFVDLDALIEKRERMKVHEIFEAKGEPYFRAVEKRLLEEVLQSDGQVIATGGGAVLDADSLRLLKKRSLLICLAAAPEALLARANSGQARPLLEAGDRIKRIEELLRLRKPAYDQAHLCIDTTALSAAGVVDKIEALLRTNSKHLWKR